LETGIHPSAFAQMGSARQPPALAPSGCAPRKRETVDTPTIRPFWRMLRCGFRTKSAASVVSERPRLELPEETSEELDVEFAIRT